MSLVLSFNFLFAFAAGPSENSSPLHAESYGSDGKWWKCSVGDPFKGCDTGPLSTLGLSKQEIAYVKTTLDQIALHPQKAQKNEIAKLLKQKPSYDGYGKQTYYGEGVGTDSKGAVSVYYSGESVSGIHW